MKKILYLIYEKKSLQIRLFALFLLLIYFPIFLNAFLLQRQTVNAVKKERIESIQQILEKTRENIAFTIDNVEKAANDTSQQMGIRKGIEDYHDLSLERKASFHNFLTRQLAVLNDKSIYIDKAAIVLPDGTVFFYKDGFDVYTYDVSSDFLYKKVIASTEMIDWYHVIEEDFFMDYGETEVSFMTHKIKDLQQEKVVGHLLVFINDQYFQDIYRQVFIGENGRVVLYDDKITPIDRERKESSSNTLIKPLMEETGTVDIVEEVKIDNENYLLSILPLENERGFVTGMIPVEELTKSIEDALRRNNQLIIFVSVILSIWILIEIIIISNLATQKETAHYRLNLSEEMNEKLRLYKHDFANHIQILQGLMEMGYGDRALKYLKSVSEEGKVVDGRYKIGVPEIEATIYNAITTAKKYNIKVEISAMELSPDLAINLYDLIKAFNNLIKNAIEAMMDIEVEDKRLKIEIYEALDEYVFKVSNNIPIIPEEMKDEIFTKGFTTKETGNGLGLYIVKSLMEKNQGKLELEVDNKGNHFFIKLPVNK
ncbi:MAG: Spo0B domain-containing protein [Clostridiaceae bacterium]|nr:Spo0B domain-containing protein [Clostridiaceae bacterium]